ncbi:MAG TPA: hypothetical protein ENH95_07955 [Nitrosopumilus sp.]|nr:hypothetical protein [Nitrosopumilus sp.]
MRKIPRPFKMPFGSGKIVGEASITSKYHEPTIQLLKFDNGNKVIRFCSYNKGKFSRSPLMIDEKELRKLGNAIKKEKELSKFISRLSS